MRVTTNVHAIQNLTLVPKIDSALIFFQHSIAGSDHQSTQWKPVTLTLNVNFQS